MEQGDLLVLMPIARDGHGFLVRGHVAPDVLARVCFWRHGRRGRVVGQWPARTAFGTACCLSLSVEAGDVGEYDLEVGHWRHYFATARRRDLAGVASSRRAGTEGHGTTAGYQIAKIAIS